MSQITIQGLYKGSYFSDLICLSHFRLMLLNPISYLIGIRIIIVGVAQHATSELRYI